MAMRLISFVRKCFYNIINYFRNKFSTHKGEYPKQQDVCRINQNTYKPKCDHCDNTEIENNNTEIENNNTGTDIVGNLPEEIALVIFK